MTYDPEATSPAEAEHLPVMTDAVLAALRPQAGEIYLDATVGLGGHALAVARAMGRGTVIGLDRDPQALAFAHERFKEVDSEIGIILTRARFSAARRVLHDLGISRVDMILVDLGLSSMQLDRPDRGFAHRFVDSDLDLRMSPDEGEPAWRRLHDTDVAELTRVLREFGEIAQARRLARLIAEHTPRTAGDLIALIERVEGRERRGRLWARVFQALRIWINEELDDLDRLLEDTPTLVGPGARVAFLAYHSLEDRRVKFAFRAWARGCVCPPEAPVCICGRQPLGRVKTPHPVVADPAEVAANPRAAAARLRAFEFSAGVAL